MRVAVIGLGRFGERLALGLSEADAEVLVVDSDEDRVRKVTDRVGRVACCDAGDSEALGSLIDKSFDAVVVTLSDISSSLMAAQTSLELGVKRVIVRARSEDHRRLADKLGDGKLEIVFPEKDAADRLTGHLRFPNLLDLIPLDDDHAVAEVTIPDLFIGRTLADLRIRQEYQVQVLAVRDGPDETWNYGPEPEHELAEGTRLLVLGHRKAIDGFPA